MRRVKHTLLVVETSAALAVAWALVRLAPWSFTTKILTLSSRPIHGDGRQPQHMARVTGVARRVGRVAGRLPWASTCLMRALAGLLLLRRRGLRAGAIRLGVRRAGEGLAAHAWLLWGGVIVMGGDEQGFQPIADLGGPLTPGCVETAS